MKKTLVFCISSLMMIALLSSCSDQQQVKSDGAGAGSDYVLNGINKQVSSFSIDGFSGASSTMTQNEDFENMKNIISIVKPVIDKIPDGYAMQITGHCADYDSAAMRQSVSTARAKKIFDELKAAGVSESKMTYKGVGSDEPRSDLDPKDFKQRRVSFKAFKK